MSRSGRHTEQQANRKPGKSLADSRQASENPAASADHPIPRASDLEHAGLVSHPHSHPLTLHTLDRLTRALVRLDRWGERSGSGRPLGGGLLTQTQPKDDHCHMADPTTVEYSPPSDNFCHSNLSTLVNERHEPTDETQPYIAANKRHVNRAKLKSRRCHAFAASGLRCRNASLLGSRECAAHGGTLPGVKRAAELKLHEMVGPALAALLRIMRQNKQLAPALGAAREVLDRTLGPTTRDLRVSGDGAGGPVRVIHQYAPIAGLTLPEDRGEVVEAEAAEIRPKYTPGALTRADRRAAALTPEDLVRAAVASAGEVEEDDGDGLAEGLDYEAGEEPTEAPEGLSGEPETDEGESDELF